MRFIKDINMTEEMKTKIKQVSKQACISLCYSDEDVYLSVLENMFGITEDLNSIYIKEMSFEDNKITSLNVFSNNYLLTPQTYPYLKYRQEYINSEITNMPGKKYGITLGVIFLPEPCAYIQNSDIEIDYIIFTIVNSIVATEDLSLISDKYSYIQLEVDGTEHDIAYISADGISLKNSIFSDNNTYTLQISQNMCSTYNAESPRSSIPFVNLIKYPNTVTLKMSQTNGAVYNIGIYENIISKNPYSDLPMYNSRISYFFSDDEKFYKFGHSPDEENPVDYVVEYYSEDLRIDEQRFYFY